MKELMEKIHKEGTAELKELSKLVGIIELERGLRSLWEIVANADIIKNENITQISLVFYDEDQENAVIEIKDIWKKVQQIYSLDDLLEILKQNMLLTSKENEIRSFKKMNYSGAFNMGAYFSIRDFDGIGETSNWNSIKKNIIENIN